MFVALPGESFQRSGPRASVLPASISPELTLISRAYSLEETPRGNVGASDWPVLPPVGLTTAGCVHFRPASDTELLGKANSKGSLNYSRGGEETPRKRRAARDASRRGADPPRIEGVSLRWTRRRRRPDGSRRPSQITAGAISFSSERGRAHGASFLPLGRRGCLLAARCRDGCGIKEPLSIFQGLGSTEGLRDKKRSETEIDPPRKHKTSC
ncbi:unnamed protein product [Lota lota]